MDQIVCQIFDARKRDFATGQINISARRVDWFAVVRFAEAARGIKVLEYEAERINFLMADLATFRSGLQFDSLPRRQIWVQIGAERRKRGIRRTQGTSQQVTDQKNPTMN